MRSVNLYTHIVFVFFSYHVIFKILYKFWKIFFFIHIILTYSCIPFVLYFLSYFNYYNRVVFNIIKFMKYYMWTYHISRVLIEYVIFSLIWEYTILIRVYILDLKICLYKGSSCTLVNHPRKNNKIVSSLILMSSCLF